MRARRLVRISASLGASLLLQARNLIVSVVVFRWFADPTELWGVVSLVVAWVTLLSLPAKFGLELTAVQLVSRYREAAPRAALEAMAQASALRVALTLVASLPLVFLPAVFAPWLGLDDAPHLVAVGGWLLLTTSLYEYGTMLLSSADDFVAMMLARLMYALVNIGGIAWIAWVGLEDPAAAILWSQVAGGAASVLLSLAVLAWQVRRLARQPPVGGGAVPPAGWGMAREILRFSLPVSLVAAAGQVFSYLDRVMIPWLADIAQLGSYALASSVVAAALFGTYAFRNVARSQLPGLLLRDPAEARATLLAGYRASTAVGIWIAAGTLACASDLLRVVYGAEVDEAARMLVWFVPYVLISAHANFSATALVAADRPGAYAVLMGGLSVLNLGLNLLLIPVLGGFGAIASSTLSLVPLAVLSYRLISQVYGEVLWTWRSVGDGAVAFGRLAGLGAVASAAGWALSAPDAVHAVGAGVIVTLVFGLLMQLTGEVGRIRAAA